VSSTPTTRHADLTAPTTETAAAERPSVRPLPPGERSLAPDLARGAVLLGIALANVPIYLHGTGPGFRPVDGSGLDQALDLLVTLLVNDRSRPMFALLLGFGLVTMARRMAERGLAPRARRRVLLRRGLWLFGFGAVHAALLFEGDILGMYGLTSLLLLVLVHRRAGVLLRWAAASVVVGAAFMGVVAVFADAVPVAAPAEQWLASVPERLLTFAGGAVVGTVLLFVLAPALAGAALARAGWLDRPWEHRSSLRRLALAGTVAGVTGGLPFALVVGRVWEPDVVVLGLVAGLHAVTGTAMGIAYVSMAGLVAARLHDRYADPGDATTATGTTVTGGTAMTGGTPRRGAVGALAATGEQSLTSYLLQSMLFAPLLAPWGLGVGEHIGTAQA